MWRQRPAPRPPAADAAVTGAERNRAFKQAVQARRALVLPGAANPLTALVIEDLGFEALYLTGAGVSNFTLGVPDLGLISLAELAEVLCTVRGVVDLPVVVDADTGFGNAVNTYHAVRRLEAAGASAIQIEDQVFPKKCGHFAGKEVVSTAEMVDKVKSALDARIDPNLQIIARTDARSVEGFAAALDRAAAYAAAGADITFVEAVTSVEEIEAVPARLPVPQVINVVFGGNTPEMPQARFAKMGFGIALYANAALQAAVAGMQTVLGELRRSGSLAVVHDRMVSFGERQRLVKKPFYDALEKRFTARGG
ncbi:MAG: oxaloacetate decarboxylase [Alphaproteobacteria bacterium]|nr:oxaloacetate decarboxylase [Alphaproteobacteria bacterium]